jgi:hypothetical protein
MLPSNVNIMNVLFVFFEVFCSLCLVVASVLIAVMPLHINIMETPALCFALLPGLLPIF